MQHRTGRYFCIACALAVLCPTLALGAPQAPPSAPVTVVNTTANPVPITGSTTVSGTIAATQSGTWTVQVVNPNAAPVQTINVDKDGRAFLTTLYLRRYVTYCARRKRYAQTQGAARLLRSVTITAVSNA